MHYTKFPLNQTPLIARQGGVKEWHFAHASRGVHQSTKHTCEFSLYVSVRMMARQLIGERLEIELPELDGRVTEPIGEYGTMIHVEFPVTPRQRLILTDVGVEKSPLSGNARLSHPTLLKLVDSAACSINHAPAIGAPTPTPHRRHAPRG